MTRSSRRADLRWLLLAAALGGLGSLFVEALWEGHHHAGADRDGGYHRHADGGAPHRHDGPTPAAPTSERTPAGGTPVETPAGGSVVRAVVLDAPAPPVAPLPGLAVSPAPPAATAESQPRPAPPRSAAAPRGPPG